MIKKEENGEEKKESVKDAVKKGVLDILKNMYDVEEEDFLSAELEIVPAGKAREAGFDRSIILAYGQDDRVCAYTSMMAMLDVEPTDISGTGDKTIRIGDNAILIKKTTFETTN